MKEDEDCVNFLKPFLQGFIGKSDGKKKELAVSASSDL